LIASASVCNPVFKRGGFAFDASKNFATGSGVQIAHRAVSRANVIWANGQSGFDFNAASQSFPFADLNFVKPKIVEAVDDVLEFFACCAKESSASGEMDTMKISLTTLGKWGNFPEIFPFLPGWEFGEGQKGRTAGRNALPSGVGIWGRAEGQNCRKKCPSFAGGEEGQRQSVS